MYCEYFKTLLSACRQLFNDNNHQKRRLGAAEKDKSNKREKASAMQTIMRLIKRDEEKNDK